MKKNNESTMSNTQLELVKNPFSITVPGTNSPIPADLENLVDEKPPVVEKTLCFSDLISAKDNNANDLPEEIKRYSNQGFFSPVIGMGQIKNRLNDNFYAKVVVNQKGKREIHYIEKYSDGTYSPEYIINQEDLFLMMIGSTSKNPKEVKEADRIRMKLKREYLSRCDGRTEISNLGQLFDTLTQVIRNLPVEDERVVKITPEHLYSEIMEVLKREYDFILTDKTLRRNGYIAIYKDGMEGIAYQIEMPFTEMIKLLDQYSLLHRTDGCKGYQAKVLVDVENGKSVYDWRYCLVDCAYFDKESQKAVEQAESTEPTEN